MQLPKYILDILETYNKAGFKAYVVGGCVRDFLLGKTPNDYDICSDALPEDTIRLFNHTVPTGIKHGTVTILSNEPVEVTTFRVEKEYIDHRHPSQVCFVGSLKEDLARRDFTINAMAYHPDTGIIDPFNGIRDLELGLVRCVGDPDTRFDEDALRMVRAHRFCAKLHFFLEEKTKASIMKNKDLLRFVSVERIRKELVQIMEMDPYELENMTILLSDIIPELKQCLECEQNSPWHDTNVLHHSLRALKYLYPFDETLAWAILMHDFGKPETKTTKDGRDHFYGHALVSKNIAHALCKKLKLTSYQQKRIPLLIEHHDDSLNADLKNIYHYCIKSGFDDEMMEQLMKLKYCDIMAHSLQGQQTIKRWETFVTFYHECKKTRPLSIKDLMVNGKDVLKYTNCKNAQIREFLEQCLIECFYDPHKNNREYWISRMKRM